MEKLEVFKVLKPQGIKGELKVGILADGYNSICKLDTVYDEFGNAFSIKNIRNGTGGFAFISIDGVISRNDAELLRGKIYFAEKSKIRKGKDDYFISDLIGLKVFVDGELFAEIIDVLNANVDMVKIKTLNDKIAYFPFLKVVLQETNLIENKICLNKNALEEVIYYEN